MTPRPTCCPVIGWIVFLALAVFVAVNVTTIVRMLLACGAFCS